MDKQGTADGMSESNASALRGIGIAVIALIIGLLLGRCDLYPPGPQSPPDPPPDPPTTTTTLERTRIVLPFYMADVKNCDAAEFGSGATLDKQYAHALQYIVRGLQWCSLNSDGVVVDVQGFASKRPFDCGTQQRSDELNLQLAEARRASVIKTIRATLDEGATEFPGYSVRIAPSAAPGRWSGSSVAERLEDMRDHLAFRDDVGEGDDKTPEIFTRRVDIVVTKKGRCEPMAGAVRDIE